MRFKKWMRSATLLILLLLFLSTKTEGRAQSEIDISLHYVDGQLAEDENSYKVKAYFSVVDETGNSISALTGDAFTVIEDSQRVEIEHLGIVQDEPINILLLIDTSGSMAGTAINETKAAVKNFISTLKPNDQVAIVTFNEKATIRIGFNTDRQATLDQLELITSLNKSGTCMYDAAYSAIQLASTLASGSRALIMFTDGIDETRLGEICSVHTIDDVLGLAKAGSTRTPIYTLEMNVLYNSIELQRMADVTGGMYLHSGDVSELANVFEHLSRQLRSQYVLTYKSFAGTGPHTLTVAVNQFGLQTIDTRNFVLPPLPTRVVFLTPREGETISDIVPVAVSLSSQGEEVNRVAFLVNDVVAGADDTKPYESELDLRSYPAGIVTISAVAYGKDEIEVARGTLNLIHSPVVIEQPTILPPEMAPAPSTAPANIRPIMLIGIVLGSLGILTIMLLIVIFVRQQQRDRLGDDIEEMDKWFLQKPQTAVSEEVSHAPEQEGHAPSADVFGSLVVQFSDDTTLIGHRFYVTSEMTTLGRSADNDISFPKDNPVSRRHAEILETGGKLFLRECHSADSAGEIKTPKYGTFINSKRVEAEPAILKTGDEILLGKRVRLKFEAGARLNTVEGRTFDEMTALDDIDKTNTQS